MLTEHQKRDNKEKRASSSQIYGEEYRNARVYIPKLKNYSSCSCVLLLGGGGRAVLGKEPEAPAGKVNKLRLGFEYQASVSE